LALSINELIALSDHNSIQLRDVKLKLITKLAIFEKIAKLQFDNLDHLWCTTQSGVTYSIKIDRKEVNQETVVMKCVPSATSFEKEESKNE
jgi:hypothetical protein